jgi:spore germination protein YaaH
VLPLAALLLLAGAGAAYFLGHGLLPGSGRPTVSLGGRRLVSGDQGIPPQPTFDVGLPGGRRASDYRAELDGSPLTMTATAAGAGLKLPAQRQGSRHHLEVWRPGSGGRHDDDVQLDFSIVAPLQAAVTWLTAPGSARAAITWSRQPADLAPLKVALQRAGAAVNDDTGTLVATWANAEAGRRLDVTIPAGFAAADGSYLAADLHGVVTVGDGPGLAVALSNPPPRDSAGLKLQAYMVSTPGGRADLVAHARQISVLSPNFYGLDGTGLLQSFVDASALRLAHQYGVEVQPLISNGDFDPDIGHALVSNVALYPEIARQLIAEASVNGYTGYQLDFENLRPADHDLLSQFSADIAGRLKAAGLNYSLAVIPRRATSSPGGQAAVYDYPALASPAGWLTLMAYDQHTRQEDPGPVAGLDWVRDVAGFTSAGVDTSRLFLGVPLYSRDFSLTGAPAARGYADTVAIAAENGGFVSWRFDIATLRAEYVADGVNHAAWLDNADSLAAKVQVARDLHLAGISAWRLGFEDPDFWSLWPTR